jgi:hypothetical protein
LLNNLCKFVVGFFALSSVSLYSLSYREQKDVKDLLKFMASHRAVTLVLRANELLALTEKTLSVHPLELTCFILTDEEALQCFERINQNFFKQQYLLNQWSDLFHQGYYQIDIEELSDWIYAAQLDWNIVEECVQGNYYTDLLRILIQRVKN